ncbi:MAG: hypothetical protein COX62_02410 [Deltaproteobacteria bacterium CG_4_10_14_0_2_um_filter_43_8]|nr:MAG: phosphate starvation-inducible protein PhoH [Deltaproteobacteria bacterium CG11_big_fil_rev_8_21_14_0_20_42_23]PJA21455.1 MAG: hypothetical protein COX62_02410 [Deltaproteobacteria bacterium CG_4_10_14_0_2_um_filter_43_8]PJC63835.1 MAG: hypothetical protein CO021_07375 [Deltaproteobacteria bacterium CG_4_9_14_0_2_um_filter_42_21]
MYRKKESVQQDLEQKIHFQKNEIARELFGPHDEHVKFLAEKLGIRVHVRGTQLTLLGKAHDVEGAKKILQTLYLHIQNGKSIMSSEIEDAIKMMLRDENTNVEHVFEDIIFQTSKKRSLKVRNAAQRKYLELMHNKDLVFAIGPAGTGKTYIAVAVALTHLLKRKVSKIILTRPAVEAGEKLGFLPGDLQDKVNPYLRPLYDALYDMLEPSKVDELLQNDTIEVAPIAFMRGRTLNNAFIILDEAQNCTYQQMKMCLTRMGADSKMVITGDITQIDLPKGESSGLLEAKKILSHIPSIAFHEFEDEDVVRHELVQDIVNAYQKHEVKQK